MHELHLSPQNGNATGLGRHNYYSITCVDCAGDAAGSSAGIAVSSAQAQAQNDAQGQAQGQGAAAVGLQATGLAQFVGDVQQMAQAWLGGASHAAMQDSSSDTEMSEAESESEDEGIFDGEGSPRGTKGRDT